MNDSLRAIILGVVEGLTEFLPISSTGHMILVRRPLGIDEQDTFWTVFMIFIQLGAILAVVLYFWRRLWRLIVTRPPAVWHEHMLVKLAVAFLPAAVFGALLDDFIEERLMTPIVVAAALVLGGIGILVIESVMSRPALADAGAIPLRVALIIGFAQCVAMIPGTSRSAATIMGALLCGLSPHAAAEFSFFLAVPTMFAAGFYSLFKHRHDIHPDQLLILALGFSVAFVTALAVIAAFMRFIQTHRFTLFALYRIVLGVAVLAAAWWGLA